VAPVGYINNRITHRIAVDPIRGPLVTRTFELYATGEYSLKALKKKAYDIGLRHCRGDRAMTKSEIHRMLMNRIYTGQFVWLGKRYQGSHEPLITHDVFERVQGVLQRKPRARYPKQQHAFMGLLRCGRCGCLITAEKKKGRYVYYRCTGSKGLCGNAYIREEQLADLLGNVITPIQITAKVADDDVVALHSREADAEQRRRPRLRHSNNVAESLSGSSIAATTISSAARFQMNSGRGNRRSGKLSWKR
jgi:hypothetical protein